MRAILDYIVKYRDTFALAMYLIGVPVVFFLRDSVRLAPDSSIFSVGLIYLPLVFSLSFKDYSKIEKPNMVLYSLLTWMILVMVAYFYLKSRPYMQYSLREEFLSVTLIAIVAISLLFIKKDALNNQFFYLAFIFSFIASVGLIASALANPYWHIGQRASFNMIMDSAGNPHISSKGAYFAIVISVLAIKYNEKIKLGLIIPIITILLSIVVLFLTQTILAFVSVFIFLAIFFVVNYSLSGVINTTRLFFSNKMVLLMMIGGYIFISYQISKNEMLLKPAMTYLENRVDRLKNSLFADKTTYTSQAFKKGDSSAETRLLHIREVFERLEENINEGNYLYVFFGHGYKFMYIDNPHLEMLDSFGILGFLAYTLIFFKITMTCVRELRNPESMGTEFLAYVFLYFFISNFIAGQMLEHTRLGTFYIIARFLKK